MGNAFGFGTQNLGNVAVEHENFCQRMGNALCGVCFGLVLFVGAIFLLGWNEFNYVRNQAVILRVQKDAIESGCTPAAGNSQQPIYASCYIQRAYDFGMDPRVKNIGLTFKGDLEGSYFKASSEILQWVEDKTCSSTSTTGGGKEKTCTYDYDLQWTTQPVDSSQFYCYPTMRSGCQRGGSQIRNSGSIPQALQVTLTAPEGQVGMGQTDASMYLLDKQQLTAFPTQPVQTAAAGEVSPLLPDKQATDMGSGSVMFRAIQGRDSVGDVRTSFSYAALRKGSSRLSVVAQQGSMAGADVPLRAWNTGMSGTMSIVDWAWAGDHSKQDMVDWKNSENGGLVMVLRLVGFVVMLLGLQLVTGPIALMPQVLPCVGELLGEVVGAALCCLNFMVSLALSFTVIGAAWLMARPLTGIILLLAAGATVFLAHALRKKYRGSARSQRLDEPFMTGPVAGMSPQAVAPSQQMQAVQVQQVQVTCPPGVQPGQMLMVQAPGGRQCQVQVPPGIQPGQVFYANI